MIFFKLAIITSLYIGCTTVFYFLYRKITWEQDDYIDGLVLVSVWVALVLFYIASVMTLLVYLTNPPNLELEGIVRSKVIATSLIYL